MVPLFTITVFLAAALLFGVQPMVAKSLLPDFGGGSSVWTTCMLFFQTTLIAGYLYAHLLLTRVPRKVQFIVHGWVIAAALVAGWFFGEPSPPPTASEFPVPWLLGQLFLVSGLPYFAISSAGPLLQGWFARTGHRRAHDPYFLYAASNAGSFVGLLAYPFVFEPTLGLDRQRAVWLALFGVFGVLAMVCLRRTRPIIQASLAEELRSGDPGVITWRRRLWWMFLAFVPSSMLLGVTTHITTDVASFPLLWVVPLGLYLLTMIAAFSGRAEAIVGSMARPMVLSLIAALVLLVAWEGIDHAPPFWGAIGVNLALLGTVGLYGHARLATDRPHAAHLTEFFLVMSVGGALGGLFNGIVAPLAFDDTYEYHAVLLCALLMLPGAAGTGGPTVKRWLLRLRVPAASLVAVLAAVFLTGAIAEPLVRLALWVLPPAVLVYMGWRDRVAAFGAYLFPMIAVILASRTTGDVLLRERTFFGVHLIERRPTIHEGLRLHRLMHGTTLHGVQLRGDPENEQIPRSYYHPAGPCGAIFRVFRETRPKGGRVCAIGLGSGGVAAYAHPTDAMLFFEIDPAVARIASDPAYFSFLSEAQGEVEVRLGDGRLLLERSRAVGERPFDLIIADAFSSDSIPTHLLTREAVALYFDRLTEDGMVAIHISNRHLDLAPLLWELATLEGASALLMLDEVPTDLPPGSITPSTDYRFSSSWVVLTKSQRTRFRLLSAGFGRFEPSARVRPWTDQYSNLLSVMGAE
jgi:hypothetical protein